MIILKYLCSFQHHQIFFSLLECMQNNATFGDWQGSIAISNSQERLEKSLRDALVKSKNFQAFTSARSVEVMSTDTIPLACTCEVETGHFPILLKRKLSSRDVNKPT